MKYLRIILKSVFVIAVIFFALAFSENSYDPGKWYFEQRATGAGFMLCAVLAIAMLELSKEKPTKKSKR